MSNIVEHLGREWDVLKKAPLAFIVLLLLGVAGGFGAGRLFYSERLDTQDGQLRRYRVALGIDEGSPNALIELTNIELQRKAVLISSRLRALCDSYNRRGAAIRKDLDAGKISKKKNFEIQNALLQEASAQFHKELRGDVLNTQNELLRRLDPKAAAAVVRMPIFQDAQTGTPLSLFSLLPGHFDAAYLCMVADEIQQLAQLLPTSAKHQ